MHLIKSHTVAALVFSSLTALSAHGAALTGGAFFRADASGNNLNGENGTLYRGGWTTVLNQQNIPGNYGYSFFLAASSTPAPADFLSPSAALSIPLSTGINTLYFWADNDDLVGGDATFGLNLFFNNAGPVSPSISGYAAPGAGQTLYANSSPDTSGLNFQYTPGTGTLSFIDGNLLITLSSFEILGTGGAFPGPGSVDLVNSDNTMPFTPPPHPNGVTDTYGQFTLMVSEIPEPGSLVLAFLGGLVLLRGRRSAD